MHCRALSQAVQQWATTTGVELPSTEPSRSTSKVDRTRSQPVTRPTEIGFSSPGATFTGQQRIDSGRAELGWTVRHPVSARHPWAVVPLAQITVAGRPRLTGCVAGRPCAGAGGTDGRRVVPAEQVGVDGSVVLAAACVAAEPKVDRLRLDACGYRRPLAGSLPALVTLFRAVPAPPMSAQTAPASVERMPMSRWIPWSELIVEPNSVTVLPRRRDVERRRCLRRLRPRFLGRCTGAPCCPRSAPCAIRLHHVTR